LVEKLEHVHHTKKFLNEKIRLLTKNQLNNRVFVITCWLDVYQYYNMQNAYPQIVIGRLALISNDLATKFIHFINDSTVHFEYEHVLLDVQFQL